MSRRWFSILFLTASWLLSNGQEKSLPVKLVEATQNRNFIETNGDTLIERGYRPLCSPSVAVTFTKFSYNKRDSTFRLRGRTLLNGMPVPIEIVKRTSGPIRSFECINESSGRCDKAGGGRFDIVFRLKPDESLLFYLGGATHAEYKMRQLLESGTLRN